MFSSFADGGARTSAKKCFLTTWEQYAVKSNDFHHSIVMGDNSWLHYLDPLHTPSKKSENNTHG
jgi:hypothetical protein